MSGWLVEPWPWWLGGPALGLLVALVWRFERRFLGVSGSVGRVVDGESASERQWRESVEADSAALDAALLQATLEHFGAAAVAEGASGAEAASRNEQRGPDSIPPVGPSAPPSAHVVLLAMLVVGGSVSALASGTWSLRWSLGEAYAHIVARGPAAFTALFAGGILVGFGTRAAGGCTTGHGLSGCARLLPASWVATAAFFGVAIVVSWLLEVAAS